MHYAYESYIPVVGVVNESMHICLHAPLHACMLLVFSKGMKMGFRESALLMRALAGGFVSEDCYLLFY